MNIQKCFLTPNKYSRPQTRLNTIKGLVIHYVGNPNSSAINNRNYFENLKSGNGVYASSHYIIGLDGEIIQCIPENEIAYCSNNRNSDTLSIENCHPKSDGKFNENTYKSLIELAADICKRYNLNPLTDVIRHYDITGKACPLYHVNNYEAWQQLKLDIKKTMDGDKLPDKNFVKLNINGDITEVRADNVNGSYVVKLSELSRVLGDIKIPIRYVLDNAGFKVSWDDNKKTINAFTHGICNNDLIILRKITEAEAGGEDEKGKILVVNVIMNRLKSNQFPNTIHDIVFQKNQFEPTRNGVFDKVIPSKNTIVAVDKAINGTDYSQGALFFRTMKGYQNSWHELNLTKLFTHGGHVFYK